MHHTDQCGRSALQYCGTSQKIGIKRNRKEIASPCRMERRRRHLADGEIVGAEGALLAPEKMQSSAPTRWRWIVVGVLGTR
jgi:hypothetical protein